jgi:hypothetical protein
MNTYSVSVSNFVYSDDEEAENTQEAARLFYEKHKEKITGAVFILVEDGYEDRYYYSIPDINKMTEKEATGAARAAGVAPLRSSMFRD